MARRRNSARSGGYRGYRKSEDEARTERLTWGLLVLAFAAFQFLVVPNWLIPTTGAAILLLSGVYQYSRRWRVSPITWMAGGVLLFFALYNWYIAPGANFLGLSLLVFAAVIAFGLITGET